MEPRPKISHFPVLYISVAAVAYTSLETDTCAVRTAERQICIVFVFVHT